MNAVKEFGDLTSFIVHFEAVEIAMHEAAHVGLKKVAVLIEKDAKAQIGSYQGAVGPFPAWAQLADSTQADRGRKGYAENDPLLRDGTLRDSISHEVEGLEAAIGSTSDIAMYQELGTSRIPPRPFIGPAAFKNKEKIENILGTAIVEGMTGGNPMGLGDYDFTI